MILQTLETTLGLRRRAVTIREDTNPHGWTVYSHGYEVGAVETFDSAAHALQSVKDADRLALANHDLSSITTITWEPTTRFGHSVVRAVTGEK